MASRTAPKGLHKKSVSKAPASKGREDSRAAQIKNDKNAHRQRAKGDPAKLAEAYAEREHSVDRERKVHRSQQPRKRSQS